MYIEYIINWYMFVIMCEFDFWYVVILVIFYNFFCMDYYIYLVNYVYWFDCCLKYVDFIKIIGVNYFDDVFCIWVLFFVVFYVYWKYKFVLSV